jgi:hypothetical protein
MIFFAEKGVRLLKGLHIVAFDDVLQEVAESGVLLGHLLVHLGQHMEKLVSLGGRFGVEGLGRSDRRPASLR